jgi:hypothetical protein
MATFTEKVVIDRMEILEDGQVQVRRATRIFKDNVFVSQAFHRHVIEPGTDVSKEDKKIRDICGVLHTKEVVDKYIADKAKSPK